MIFLLQLYLRLLGRYYTIWKWPSVSSCTVSLASLWDVTLTSAARRTSLLEVDCHPCEPCDQTTVVMHTWLGLLFPSSDTIAVLYTAADDKQATVLLSLDLSTEWRLTQSTKAYYRYSNFCSPGSALRNTTGLAPVIPWGLDSVCQAGSASVTSREVRGQDSSRVCARASIVCRLVQPGRKCHHRPWSSLPPNTLMTYSSISPWVSKTQLQVCSCREYRRHQKEWACCSTVRRSHWASNTTAHSVFPAILRTYAGRCFLVAGFYEPWPPNLGVAEGQPSSSTLGTSTVCNELHGTMEATVAVHIDVG